MAFVAGTSTAPPVKDYQARIEKLRKDAAECALIRDLATDKAKREMFDRLASPSRYWLTKLNWRWSNEGAAQSKSASVASHDGGYLSDVL
jgi:hypothetical protein